MVPYSTVFTLMAASKDAVLAEGVRQAQTMAGATKPTLDQIKIATFGYAKQVAASWVLPGLIELFTNASAAFVQAMGPRPGTAMDDPDYVAWRDAFDEHVLDALGVDMVRDASQDFIGEYINDTAIDDPDTRNRASQILADRLIDAAVKGRTPGQVLAEIGIAKEDMASHAQPETPAQAAASTADAAPVIEEAHARAHVERLVGAYAIGLGVAGFDPAAVGVMLKEAFDTEEFVALGPIERMGGKRVDWPFFVAYAKASPTHVDDTVNAAFMAAMTGALVEPPKDMPKPKKLTKKQIAEQAKAAAATASPTVAPPPVVAASQPAGPQTAGVDYAAVIKALHEHNLAGGEALGKMIGVSRGTIDNIVKKGRACQLTEEHKATLRKAIEERVIGLQTALASLL